MFDIFKLHWRIVKHPSDEIKNTISQLPLPLGISLYVLYLLRSQFQSGDSYRMISDIIYNIYHLESRFAICLYVIITISFTVLIHYFLLPIFLRLLSKQSKEEFDPVHYRKLIFYSPISYVIFSVFILLPLQILLSIYLFYFDAGIFVIIYGLLYALLGLWTIVLIVNILVVQWKGLKIYYNIKGIKSFLLVFVIPLIGFIPMLIIYGRKRCC